MKKLRSNSKEVKEAIKQHLIEISSNDDVEVETVDQAIQYIVNKFYNEMLKHDKSNKSIQDLFIYWLNGLSLNTYYTYTDIINYLNGIGLYGKKWKTRARKSSGSILLLNI